MPFCTPLLLQYFFKETLVINCFYSLSVTKGKKVLLMVTGDWKGRKSLFQDGVNKWYISARSAVIYHVIFLLAWHQNVLWCRSLACSTICHLWAAENAQDAKLTAWRKLVLWARNLLFYLSHCFVIFTPLQCFSLSTVITNLPTMVKLLLSAGVVR